MHAIFFCMSPRWPLSRLQSLCLRIIAERLSIIGSLFYSAQRYKKSGVICRSNFEGDFFCCVFPNASLSLFSCFILSLLGFRSHIFMCVYSPGHCLGCEMSFVWLEENLRKSYLFLGNNREIRVLSKESTREGLDILLEVEYFSCGKGHKLLQ